MKYLKRLSIRKKLILIIVSVSTLAAVLGLVLEFYAESARIIKAKTKNTLFDAQLISSYCVMPMAFDDLESAHEILKNLADAPQMHLGVLFISEDSVFALNEILLHCKPAK